MIKTLLAAAAAVLMSAVALAQTSAPPQPEQNTSRGHQCERTPNVTS